MRVTSPARRSAGLGSWPGWRGDRVFALVERESGIYTGAAGDVAPGQWDLVIEAVRGNERVFLSRNRVVLQ